jgi:hypothetical protein
MLALVAGFFLVCYLLAPGAIYRLAFSFFIPSKRFQRNRTEEIIFSVFAVLFPFLITWGLLGHTRLGTYPLLHSMPSKTEAYRQVFQSLLSSASVKTDIYDAYRRVLREQTRFLIWLWSLCFGEGLLNGAIVTWYGSFSDRSPLKWFCDQFLLKHVSEWQILFTTIALPSQERQKAVEVDVLCGGTLYRGRLVNWFADQDGKLAGIFITEAARFRRDDWNRDRAADKPCKPEDYWRKIQGAKLYLAAAPIINYNIRYVDTLESSEALISNALGMEITIKAAPPDNNLQQ